MPHTPNKELRERFADYFKGWYLQGSEDILKFLESEIARAVREERQTWVNEIVSSAGDLERTSDTLIKLTAGEVARASASRMRLIASKLSTPKDE